MYDDWLRAQCSVLGSALIEPDLVPKIIAETSERDYSGPCQTVFKAIRKLLDDANGLMVDKPSVKITTMDLALKSFMARHGRLL